MNCKNCEISLNEADAYCKACGAQLIKNRLTISNLLEHFSSQFLNYDNKFLKTFVSLLKKPEVVIGAYIDGTRKKYINPISYFAIAITIAGLELYVTSKFFPEKMIFSALNGSGEDLANEWMTFSTEYQSIILMLMLPLYALLSKVVFFNQKKYNYTEHLVMYIYILSQLTLLLVFPTLICMALGFTLGTLTSYTLLFQIGFTAYCLKRVFNLSFGKIVLKTLLFLAVLLVFYIISIIIYIIIMIIYHGGAAGFMEASMPAK
ncbi:MAG: DUF3667 domain-containing protein [Xanthomarina sp.]